MDYVIALVSSPENWVALLTLTALEIVLGIDNIVFIAILTDRLPPEQRPIAYRLGLGGAMITRILLLLSIFWVMRLTEDIFTVLGHGFSGRDLILLIGGIFLIGKAAHEIYEKVEGSDELDEDEEEIKARVRRGMIMVVGQIMIMDIIFSLDSVITAVGMAQAVEIMITAVVVAVAVMMIFAKKIGDFVNRNPSMKILALSFLLLIGVLLTVEGLDQHVNKGYIYFAMTFALLVELLNMRLRKKHKKRPTVAPRTSVEAG
jgi:predicted tellurium resistance membrane protein TerC